MGKLYKYVVIYKGEVLDHQILTFDNLNETLKNISLGSVDSRGLTACGVHNTLADQGYNFRSITGKLETFLFNPADKYHSFLFLLLGIDNSPFNPPRLGYIYSEVYSDNEGLIKRHFRNEKISNILGS